MSPHWLHYPCSNDYQWYANYSNWYIRVNYQTFVQDSVYLKLIEDATWILSERTCNVSKHRMDGTYGYDSKSWQKYNSDSRDPGNFRTIANILSWEKNSRIAW
jgi:hypothetical protein